MKNQIKTFGLIGFSILALMLAVNFVSAVISFSNIPTLSRESGINSNIITVTSDQNETIDFSGLSSITTKNGKTVTFTIPSSITVTAGSPKDVTISYDVPVDSEFEFGNTYITSLTASGDVSPDDATQPLTFEQTPFCEWDDGIAEDTNHIDLETQIRDITVTDGFGDDEDWFLFDNVEVEIEVRNRNNDYDIDNVVVEWGIYNTHTKEWTREVEDEKDFDIKDGEKETITVNFKIDKSLDEDFEDLRNGNFLFYARATGEVDDDAGAYDVCSSDSKEVNIVADERDFVILNNIKMPETVPCGDFVDITADVWNVGRDDQDDVSVKVINQELGLNENVLVGDIDSFEDEPFNFEFKVPTDADEKIYTISFYVYNEDNELYQNDYDDDEAIFTMPLKVEGACVFDPQLLVSAELESGGMAGEELGIRATITNLASSSRVLEVDANGYDSWADLTSVSPNLLTLQAGESKEVLFRFNVDDDASGDEDFNIQLSEDNELIVSQPVSVSIEEKSSGLGSLFTGGVITQDNWYLWGIGVLNVVLVIIIIVVAARLARKKE